MGDGVPIAEQVLLQKDLGAKPDVRKALVTPHSLIEQLKYLGLDSFEKVTAIATDENFLGEGGNASIFAIPNNDQYVVRIQHRAWVGPTEGELELLESPFSDMNVGQAVARLGNAFILKRQEGIPAGLTHVEIRRLGLTHELANLDYLQRTTLAANMPQQAYDELAELIRIINEKGYNFDPSKPNNILIDEKRKRFNLIDLNSRDPSSDYRDTLTSLVVPLMNNSYAWQVNDPDIEQHLVVQRGKILEKAIQASIKANLPVSGEGDSSLEYSFKIAGREGQWSAQRQAIISTQQAPT